MITTIKKSELLLPILIWVISLLSLQSCEKTVYIDYVVPEVGLTRLDAGQENSMKIRFTPSQSVVRYQYAISSDAESDIDKFISGEYETVEVMDTVEKEVVFNNLDEESLYTIFAIAYNESGETGPVAVLKDQDFPFERLSCEMSYLGPDYASIKMFYDHDISKCRYYLGQKDDREAFLNGETESMTMGEIKEFYNLNFYDLEPEKDYVFYALGYDLIGSETNLIEMDFRTPALDKVPYATFEIKYQDAFRGEYMIQGNDKCGRLTLIICEKGYYDFDVTQIGTAWKNNWMTLIKYFEDNNVYCVSSDKGFIDLENLDATFPMDKEKEIYLLLYDKDGKEFGVQHFVFETDKTDPSREKANVSIEISDITEKGASYTYKFDKNTLGFFYETVDADWYDSFKASGRWYESYMRDNLMMYGTQYWFYAAAEESGQFVFNETGGQSKKRYYAVACPMNFNGATPEGWAPEILAEYTTL